MYQQIYEQMEDAGVAVKMAFSKWNNKKGEVTREEDSFGCMVTRKLTHPAICIVMDKVGLIQVKRVMETMVVSCTFVVKI